MCIFMNINENVKTIVEKYLKALGDAYSYTIDDTIDKSFCNGCRGDSWTYCAHLGQFLMGVKLFNWTSKKKLVMLKHMDSMVSIRLF